MKRVSDTHRVQNQPDRLKKKSKQAKLKELRKHWEKAKRVREHLQPAETAREHKERVVCKGMGAKNDINQNKLPVLQNAW